MNLEQEIKLQVLQEQALDLSRLPVLLQWLKIAPYTQQLSNLYFDTNDKDLLRLGVALRLRKVDSKWYQTIKMKGEVVDGVHQRQEWEHEIKGPRFDAEQLAQSGFLTTMKEDRLSLISKVRAQFSTDFERLIMELALPNDTEVELAYDRGLVKAREKQKSIHEIELELKQGDLAEMKKLAEALMQELPVKYSNVSKAEQGFKLSQTE